MSKPEVSKVRSPIDVALLTKYLSSLNASSAPQDTTYGVEVPDFSKAELGIEQFTFGQLNPTYLLTDQHGNKYVLRRKPLPNAKLVSKSAHSIEREFFILKLIGHHNLLPNSKKVPIPKTFLLCEDELVIGYVFYMMQYVDGEQIKNPALPGIAAADKPIIRQSVIDTIAAIHLLDVQELSKYLPKKHFPQFHNLEKLKGSTYFQRQLKSLNAVAKMQLKHVDPIPDFDRICEWMQAKAPKDPSKLCLIHGDFKIDNILFDRKTRKVQAVLDWELCTVGHPLFDLGNYLQPFQMPVAFSQQIHKDGSNIGAENPESIRELKAFLVNYAKAYGPPWDANEPTNNPVDKWMVGFVFGLLRLCVITQGIAMRNKQGNASSAQAHMYGLLYPILAGLAIEHIDSMEGAKL